MRREKKIVIDGARSETPGHRDDGKVFIVHEMPADQGERWCMRATELITKALGQTVPSPEQLNVGGAAQLASVQAPEMALMSIARALVDPTLESLWDYIEYQHAPNVPARKVVQGENSDIEEIATRTRLRMEVLTMQTGFSGGAEPQTSAATQPQTSS